MFVFVYSLHHLEVRTFFASYYSKQDHPRQEHYEQAYKVIYNLLVLDNMLKLSRMFRLFWIPKKIRT